jgi:2-polyprenyl-3-methyl-5-hydroxy-6-metoxy-1,4-benzoquinol methylase
LADGGSVPHYSPISLSRCQSCGLVFNASFDSGAVQLAYKSNQYFPKSVIQGGMSSSLTRIAGFLERLVPVGGTVLEIGSGNGAIAEQLARKADAVLAFDPSANARDISGDHVTFVNDFFSGQRCREITERPFDLVYFRHLLEHLDRPGSFLQEVDGLLSQGGVVYVEVPNFDEICSTGRFYDIFNDHFSYFTSDVLARHLQRAGYSEVARLNLFQGQHMGLVYRKGALPEDASLDGVGAAFGALDFSRFHVNRSALNQWLAAWNGSIGLYGAGAHGNAMLNHLDDAVLGRIVVCLDRDPAKIGLHLQGPQAIPIKAPDVASLATVEAILITSALYEEEVVGWLRAQGFAGPIVRTANGVVVDRQPMV